MMKMISRMAMVAMMAAGAFSAAPAMADGFGWSVEIRDGGGRWDEVQYRDERDWNRGRDRGYDHGRDRGRHGGEGWRGRCAPWLAIDKARAHGLRRPDIAGVSRNRVVVEGRRHGYRAAIAFANVRGCPVIARW
ncbi:hypothetical protein [Ensifer soli]|uniref:hypothetical protein n=1 Tax=Ciceribacter sp. sgz301302 TaxID=3342379 RepID=UPI0035B98C8B